MGRDRERGRGREGDREGELILASSLPCRSYAGCKTEWDKKNIKKSKDFFINDPTAQNHQKHHSSLTPTSPQTSDAKHYKYVIILLSLMVSVIIIIIIHSLRQRFHYPSSSGSQQFQNSGHESHSHSYMYICRVIVYLPLCNFSLLCL